MPKRPLTVTVVATMFLAVGASGTVRSFATGTAPRLFSTDNLWGLALSLVALLCGIFLLRRQNWARWLALAWITAHVAISFLNSLQGVAVHALFLLLIAYILFRPEANAWFRYSQSDAR